MDESLPLLHEYNEIEETKQKTDPMVFILGCALSLIGIFMSIYILIITYLTWNIKKTDHQQILNLITSSMCICISVVQLCLLKKNFKAGFVLLLFLYLIYSGFIGVGICLLYPYMKADQSLLYISSFVYYTLCWTLPILFLFILFIGNLFS